MKYVKQITIILSIAFIGELLQRILPFPKPASIYGMAILFTGLVRGIVRLDWVKEVGGFLVEIMPIFFIPVCVGLIDAWLDIQSFWLPISIAVSLITVIVMVVTGKTAQFIIRRKRREEDHE